MTESWAFYVCLVEDKIASVRVNLEADAPQPEKPVSLLFTIQLRQPREDGLSDRSEFDALCKLEDDVLPMLTEQLDAELVGCVTTDGRRDFYLYAPKTPKLAQLKSLVEQPMKTHSEYVWSVRKQDDEDWWQYLDFLYPTRMQLESIKNRQVIDELLKYGDNLELPRLVDHSAYFAEKDMRAAFANRIKTLGYTVQFLEPVEAPVGSNAETIVQNPWPYGLQFSLEHRVDLSSIDSIVGDLLAILDEYEGQYDGWGCPTATAASR